MLLIGSQYCISNCINSTAERFQTLIILSCNMRFGMEGFFEVY